MSFGEALRFWVKLGFINFGGPAGQIAIMHREIVDRRGWVGEDRFLRALNFAMILPGPEATQLAIYIGWLMHGTLGGIVAGVFFILPSVFVLLLLSYLVAAHGQVPAIAGLLYGVQPVVVAIVAEAVFRLGRRTLRHPVLTLLAAVTFSALYLFAVPFPLIVAAAAASGIMLRPLLPAVFGRSGGDDLGAGQPEPRERPGIARLLRIILLFAALWALPVGAVRLWRGGGDVLVHEALFFTGAAFVTFGGAYAVLSYIAHAAVTSYGWLTASQMVQGLALAESTPGPLIMVTQYVGFLGGWNLARGTSPLLNGLLGGLLTTYVTFLFCFMFIFAGAPYVESLAGNRRIQAAFVGVTAAIVGVILNLAVFFGTRVLFPGYGRPDLFAFLLALLSFAALWRSRIPVPYLVGAGAVIGASWALWGGTAG